MRCVRVAAAVLLLATGCTGSVDRPPTPANGVVVASFNFDESRLLAEIYAQALEDEGVVVQRQLDLGQRELVLPALREGLVDVVPEYAGSALDAAAPGSSADRGDVTSVLAALDRAVAPWGLTPLAPSTASNQNVLAVTRATAETLGLTSISDLARTVPIVLGGPPECRDRPGCLPGLQERYALQVTRFVPFTGAALVRRALDDDVIDVGVLFSTDAQLADDDLVILDDDRGLQPPDEVVPLVRTAVLDDDAVGKALDEVSARAHHTRPALLELAGGQRRHQHRDRGQRLARSARPGRTLRRSHADGSRRQRPAQASAASASSRSVVARTSSGWSRNSESADHRPAPVVPPKATGCRSERSKRNWSPASRRERAIRRPVAVG